MTDDIAEEEPFAPFARWFALAAQSEPLAEAMMLATATRDGIPSVRAVLLKGADANGFVFYTNRQSRKSDELYANPRAALCLYWKSLARQIRVEGAVVPVSEDEADAYFASRARQPDRRLGLRPVATAAGPRGAGAALPDLQPAIRRGGCGAAADALVRLPAPAGTDRVLAGAAVPAARSRAVHPRRRSVAQAAPVPVARGA